MKPKKQHSRPAATAGANITTVSSADALRKKQESLQAQGYFAVPMPDGYSGGTGGELPGEVWDSYLHARMMSASVNPGAKPAAGIPTFHLSSGIEVPTPEGVGAKGLGYMAWGSSNRNPNVVSQLSEVSPYTAASHRFNTDLCAGRGPRPMYAYVQYVGGNITEKRIPYADAGILIKGWLRDLRRELQKEQQGQQNGGNGSVPADAPPIVPGGSATGNTDTPLMQDIREQIAALEKDYARWEATNAELTSFLANNNLPLTYLSLVEDMQQQNLCFPELTLNKRTIDPATGQNLPTSMWTPHIVGIRYRSAHICRLERRDPNGRINNVYLCNQWNERPYNTREEDYKITALPALDPQAPLGSLQHIVRETRKKNGSIRQRPTRYILPLAYPSAGRPYYPVPSWQSIFSGDIYEYLTTMVSDRNKRRRNSNVIGRILYLNNEYMNHLYHQKQADSPDDKMKVFNELRNQINTFLEDRDNTGKPLVAYTFLGSDGKTYNSWEIVEIQSNNKQTADANQKELAEIASVVFFAFGLDARLVGNVPGDTSSSGGTDLRERYLLKQIQMSPMQQLLLLPLYLMKSFNGLDPHLEWEIAREVLTTLDNSKTGIAPAAQP